uniref:Uncharacterized protein n=1 Tax=candidate division WOR-3 bacterium TaxID=2052148 RepID=A0A7V3KMW3_UNCW3
MKKLIIDSSCEMAHLGIMSNRFCLLAPNFPGARGDLENGQKSYWAIECDICGRPLSDRRIRVRVDHEATGTRTSGTGDTVVRRI